MLCLSISLQPTDKTSHRFVLQLYVFFFVFFKKFKFKCFSSHWAVLWFGHKAHLVRVWKNILIWFKYFGLHVLVPLLQLSWRCFQVSLKTQVSVTTRGCRCSIFLLKIKCFCSPKMWLTTLRIPAKISVFCRHNYSCRCPEFHSK